MIENTPEQIARHYSSAMDSVSLINELKAKASLTQEETERMKANVDHLKIMLSRDYWTTEDLIPFQLATA